MKIKRTENAKKGIIFGTISNIYTVLVPFCMRTVMLYTLGVQYLGLNSLFTSVLQVLNLTELGVGTAMVYSMYKPIAEDDTEKICALMRMYKIYYRIIGLVVCLLGVMLIPFLPELISGSVPEDINIYTLYGINLASTVLTYWLFAYKNSLLNAFQRRDVLSKIAMVTNTLKYVFQILALIIFESYYAYVIVMLSSQIINNIVTACVVDRMYPQYRARNKLPKEDVRDINARIRDLFTQKIGGIINSNADTLVISAFLGLTSLAIYQNYYYVMSLPLALSNVIFDSCRAGFGNSLATESKEKNLSDLKKFTFLLNWVVTVCAAGLICLYQHFMYMWMGEELLLSFGMVILFVIYFYIIVMEKILGVFKDAGGIWHQDRLRPLFAALLNLTLNLIMVRVIGIYGILLSTIISMLVLSVPWELYNIFTVIFEKKDLSGYVLELFRYAAVAVLICIISVYACSYVTLGGILGFLLKGIIALMISDVLLLAIFFRAEEFNEAFKFVKGLLQR